MMQLPLPESDKDYLRSFRGIFSNPAEAEQYLYDSWERMQVVLGYLAELEQKGARSLLELGANPYYLTLLIQKYFHFDLHLANFFTDATPNGKHQHDVEYQNEKRTFEFHHFNVEKDPFPYEDGSFDCVIFCEIIEHLLLSADFPVGEIARILKPGGYVIVSTPNAARLANLVHLMRGKNIYADYSAYGIYGRHNREYTLPELKAVLERHSFRIVDSKVRNIYSHPLKSRVIQALRPNVWYEHLFVLAQKK